MKNFLALITCLAFSVTVARAGTMEAHLESAELNLNQNYFETLGELFAKGTLPDLNKISDIAWAGRCFTSEAPSRPIAGGYIFRKAQSPDVGPLGNGSLSYEGILYWNKSKSPSYFDNMTLQSVLREISHLSLFPAVINNYSVEVNTIDTTEKLRVSGKYLVVEGVVNSSKKIFARCYFFLPKLQH